MDGAGMYGALVHEIEYGGDQPNVGDGHDHSEYERMFINIGWRENNIPEPLHTLPEDSPLYLLMVAVGNPCRIRSREAFMNKVQQSQNYDQFKDIVEFNLSSTICCC